MTSEHIISNMLGPPSLAQRCAGHALHLDSKHRWKMSCARGYIIYLKVGAAEIFTGVRLGVLSFVLLEMDSKEMFCVLEQNWDVLGNGDVAVTPLWAVTASWRICNMNSSFPVGAECCIVDHRWSSPNKRRWKTKWALFSGAIVVWGAFAENETHAGAFQYIGT